MNWMLKLPSGSALVSLPWLAPLIYQPLLLLHSPAATPHKLGACCQLGHCWEVDPPPERGPHPREALNKHQLALCTRLNHLGGSFLWFNC